MFNKPEASLVRCTRAEYLSSSSLDVHICYRELHYAFRLIQFIIEAPRLAEFPSEYPYCLPKTYTVSELISNLYSSQSIIL
jgi:hypothetical protein